MVRGYIASFSFHLILNWSVSKDLINFKARETGLSSFRNYKQQTKRENPPESC